MMHRRQGRRRDKPTGFTPRLEALEARLTPSGTPRFVTPLPGTPGQDWIIGNYVDLNPEAGAIDYRGGSYTYENHNGLDFILPNFSSMDAGVPVLAAAAGTVVEVHDGEFDRQTDPLPGAQANFVRIDHGDGWITEYYQLRRDSIIVRAGDSVEAGQVVGMVGSSGLSTQPHLGFNVLHNGEYVETYQTPEVFWGNPVPYTGSRTGVFDFGLTDIDPIPGNLGLRNRPAEHNVYGPGTTQRVYFWVSIYGLPSGAPLDFSWYRPDGSLYFRYQPDAAQVQQFNYGGWTTYLNLPASPDLGEWQVVLRLNGQELARDSFLVTTDPVEQAGSVGFESAHIAVTENGGNAVINLTRNGMLVAASVSVSLEPGTATTDDIKFAPLTVSFGPGERVKQITIPIQNDTLQEGQEALTLRLSDAVGVALGENDTTSLSIIDDDRVDSPNQRFVAQAYLDLLNRPVDASSLTYWLDRLTNGTTRAEMAETLLASREYQISQVQQLYQTLLGRAPDSAGLVYFVNFLDNGGSLDFVRAALLGSDEYFRQRGNSSADGFIDALYLDVLGRSADPVGLLGGREALTRGVSRFELALAIVGSEESRGRTVRSAYQQYLQRPADDGGLHFWTDMLMGGYSERDFAAFLLASEGYLERG